MCDLGLALGRPPWTHTTIHGVKLKGIGSAKNSTYIGQPAPERGRAPLDRTTYTGALTLDRELEFS